MVSKYLTFLSAFLFQAALAFGQGQLSFGKDSHDFGVVVEGTQATYDFEFTNDGNAPVIISNVSASCGCTTPFWTKEPVLPGKKGKVTASYNSAGRPGVFYKTVTVVSNAQNANVVLTIKGTVEPKPVVTATPAGSRTVGPAGVEQDQPPLRKVEKGQPVSQVFTVRNTGKSDLNIQTVQSGCNCVSYKASQPTIAPGGSATIELRYNPLNAGQQNETVNIYSTDLQTPVHKVELAGKRSGKPRFPKTCSANKSGRYRSSRPRLTR
jgi:hypothetical protein